MELVRIGGSTRMVAAMLAGSAPIIPGAMAAIAATAAGSEVVIIAASGNVSPFHLMARRGD